MSVVARADRVEGTLRVQDALRVQGTVQGTVEARTVFVDEGARLHADVTADEVVIAGEYSGKLVCRQRLEVRASGSIAGQFETVRLMLHEGASVDGELRMLKQPTANGEPARGGATIRGGRGDAPARAPAAPAAAAPAADQSVQQG
jgi:cytoskeletal protein CcmA (bactofilin family)